MLAIGYLLSRMQNTTRIDINMCQSKNIIFNNNNNDLATIESSNGHFILLHIAVRIL
jgi:hypothetical protein